MDEKTGGKRAVYDTESNGFLYESTKIHCISILDLDSNDTYDYHVDNGSSDVSRGIDHLDSFQLAIGHHICGHDIPLVYKLYGRMNKFSPRDTYILSKMFFPEQKLHSIEFYGDKFGRVKPEHEDWTKFTPEMMHRCREDVGINAMLYKWFIEIQLSKWKWIDALKLEQDFQIYQSFQEMVGMDIDVELAKSLLVRMDKEIEELDKILNERLPLRVVNLKAVNKPFKKDGSYSKMCEDWYACDKS